MIETLIGIAGLAVLVIGVVGSIIPGLPGLALTILGVLTIGVQTGEWVGATIFLVLAGLGICMDWFAPLLFVKWGIASKDAGLGATIGLILGFVCGLALSCASTGVGLPLSIVMFFLFPFTGAFLSERHKGKTKIEAAKSGLVLCLGLVMTTGVKMVVATSALMWGVLVLAFST